MSNVVNYSEQGGNKWVVGGELDVTGTLKVNGAAIGQAAAQADSTATDVDGLKADHNALLAKLRAAGLLDT